MTREKKEEKEGRIGVPRVGEVYQEMAETKEAEDEVAKRERKKMEKEHRHQEQEKVKGYERHLPPVEERIREERPPFKKR